MIYECVVIDSSCFWDTGKIRVRMCWLNNYSHGSEPLEKDPERSYQYSKFYIEDEEEGIKDEVSDSDIYAELSSCIGGAYDSGVFYLPQPNSHGLISKVYVNGTEPRYVWLGAIMTLDPPMMGGEFNRRIDGPGDALDVENIKESGKIKLSKKEWKSHAVLFKQKETSWAHDDDGNVDFEASKDTLDWKKAPLLNMAVIDKGRTFLVHNMYNSDDEYIGQAHISIDNSEGISIDFQKTEDDETYESSMKILTDGTARLVANYNNKVVNSFEATTSLLTITHQDENITGNIIIGNQDDTQSNPELKLQLIPKGGSEAFITLNKNSLDIQSAGNISLSPKAGGEITLGAGAGYILTASHPGSISNFENETFTALDKVKA